MSRRTAQERVDRIEALRAELAELEREHVLELSAADRVTVDRHHASVVGTLARDCDVDVASGQRRLSLGMRIAAAFGAVALGLSVFLFFDQVWSDLSTVPQVAILIGGPLVGLGAMAVSARLERTLYVTGILGVMTIATFVVDLYGLGQMFNLTPSPNAFLAWGVFSLVLAYTVRLRWLLTIGLGALAVWASAALVSSPMFGGLVDVWSVFDRLETFFVPAVAMLVVSTLQRDEGFAATWRVMGALTACVALFVLSVGGQSALPWSRENSHFFYEVSGLAFTAGAIAAGVRWQWRDMVNLGSSFFAVFLLTRLSDWLWVWMPSYLFFLLIGGLALGLIAVFRRLRHEMEPRA